MKMLMLSALVVLSTAAPTLANDPYLTLEGCFAKTDADLVVAMALLDGSGGPVWTALGMSGRCVFTYGPTQIKEIYSSHTDRRYGDQTVLYVRYELLRPDGSWQTIYGFMPADAETRCETCY